MRKPHYHHGDLRRALLDGALATIAERGPAALSLRDVARRAGVSHAAPAHHFRDKADLLTAIAIEGFELIAATTRSAEAQTHDLIEDGIAYIRFALEHPAHYQVMFRPDLYHRDDPRLTEAWEAAAEVLFDAVRRVLGPGAQEEEVLAGVLATWSFAHGFAGLWSTGNLPSPPGMSAEDLARAAAGALVRMVMAGGGGDAQARRDA
jgi:AcrR family transcriptional regulator